MSYCHSIIKLPRVYRTIPDLLDENATKYGDKVAHVFWTRDNLEDDIRRQTLSFSQLADDSIKVASGLLELGLRPKDRIAIYGPASPEWMQVDLACLRIQVLMIRLPQTLVFSEHLGQFLKDHKCRMLVLDPRPDRRIFKKITDAIPATDAAISKATALPGPFANAGLELVISTCRVPGYNDAMCVGDVSQMARSDLSHVRGIQSSADPDDIAVVYATSGSTGIPKLVAVSNMSIVNSMISVHVGPETVLFNDRLFSWMGAVCYFSCVVGATHVHIESLFTTQPENIVRLFELWEKENVHFAVLPAYMVHKAISALDAGSIKKPPGLVALNTAGEKLLPALRQRVLDQSMQHMIVYGSTECGTVCVDVAVPGVRLPADDGITPPAMTLTEDTEVKVTDEVGRILPLGHVGELWVRGGRNFVGYLDNEAVTAATITPAGWVSSGDLAALDSSGKIRLYGRKVDIIAKGGVKVYPSTLEAMIKRHDDVKDVYITGVPDVIYNEEIAACVIPKTGCRLSAEELRSFCERSLDSSSGISLVPKYISIMDELPVLPSGKVDRLRLKAMFCKIQQET